MAKISKIIPINFKRSKKDKKGFTPIENEVIQKLMTSAEGLWPGEIKSKKILHEFQIKKLVIVKSLDGRGKIFPSDKLIKINQN